MSGFVSFDHANDFRMSILYCKTCLNITVLQANSDINCKNLNK